MMHIHHTRGRMQNRRIAPIIAALSLSICSMGASGQQAPLSAAATRAVGSWSGQLTAGAMSMRLQVTIRRDSAGGLAGVLKAIDQGGAEAPAMVDVRGDTVSFAIPAERVTYSGV